MACCTSKSGPRKPLGGEYLRIHLVRLLVGNVDLKPPSRASVFRGYVPVFLDLPSQWGDNVRDSCVDLRLALWGNVLVIEALNLLDLWGHFVSAKDNSNTVSNRHVALISHLPINCLFSSA
jgi:hypothetical protein